MVVESVAVVGPVGASVKSIPVPESAAVCVGVGALSTKVMAPMAAPAVVGAKTICRAQAALAASDAAQVLDAMTKPELAVMEVKVRVCPPLLVSVMVCATEVSV